MYKKEMKSEIMEKISSYPRFPLALLPTPMQSLENLSASLSDVEVWMKRDDLTGLEGGGNKTRKLEFLIADAKNKGADTLATIGAIQSNHTRQTAASAAKAGMKCALLHFKWTKDAGEMYRKVGNILYSSIFGADLYVDNKERPIEDQGPLSEFGEYLESKGQKPYLITGGASENELGCLGYMVCAVEIMEQCDALGFEFDYIVHCTGSSSTQAGLVAGLAAMGSKTKVVGIPDDEETIIKKVRVEELSNNTLKMLNIQASVSQDDFDIIACDTSHYGESDATTFEGIKEFARMEGIIVDPVYEGNALRGLKELTRAGHFEKGSKILLMHLGGTPAVHAYANQFDEITLLEDFKPTC